MTDPFFNLYDILYNTALHQNCKIQKIFFPELGCNDPKLLQYLSTGKSFYDNLVHKKIIFHDQEPIEFLSFNNDWLERIHFLNRLETNHILSNSEINSIEKNELLAKSGWHDFYWFSNGFLSLEWYRYYEYAKYLEESWQPRNFFSSYNRLLKNRNHRYIIAKHLYQRYPNNIILSCHSDENLEENIFIKTVNSVNKNLSYTIDLKDFIDSFCHLVTERIFYEDRIHLTEKVFRPIICCRPFILVSSRGSLAYLKTYGFKTFDRFWSERYDDITDHNARIEEILNIVNYIGSLSQTEMLNMLFEMKEILLYNRQHFYGKFKEIITYEMYSNLDKALNAQNNRKGYFDKILDSLTHEELAIVQQCKFIGGDDINGPNILRQCIKTIDNQEKILRSFIESNIGYFANYNAASNYFKSQKGK
jgi:hypothetical protein